MGSCNKAMFRKEKKNLRACANWWKMETKAEIISFSAVGF